MAAPHLSESQRTEAFSDGVFAIIVTILVLDIRIPPHQPGHLMEGLVSIWPSLLAYLISFLYVGIIWINHHGLFARVRRVDLGLMWTNLIGLLFTALLPFPTHVFADAIRDGNLADQKVAAGLYATVAFYVSAGWLPIFPYLRDHPELLREDTPPAFFHAQRLRPWVGVASYGLAILASFYSPWAAMAFFAWMIVFHAATSQDIAVLFRRKVR